MACHADKIARTVIGHFKTVMIVAAIARVPPWMVTTAASAILYFLLCKTKESVIVNPPTAPLRPRAHDCTARAQARSAASR